MKQSGRLSGSPGAALGLIAVFFALGGSAFAVGDAIQTPSIAQQRCANGAVRGIAVVTGNPSAGMANFPDSFTGAGFSRKFNCTGKAVQARRVEVGVFEVRFGGISGASGLATGSGDIYATVQAAPDGVFRVTMHPSGRDDRIDVAFTIVVV
jgi:hypothetical protein